MDNEKREQGFELTVTDRGFNRLEFQDRDGIRCHLQESSLATEPAIRVGCSELGLIHLVQDKGWMPVEGLPARVQGNTTMHLTQRHVAVLLPYLLEFMLFGTVGDVGNLTDSYNRMASGYKEVLGEHGGQSNG